MSSASSNEKYILLYSFLEKVDRLMRVNAHETHSNPSTLTGSPRTINTRDITFGIQDGLLDILERIYSLHVSSASAPNMKPDSIMDAVDIWKDLDDSKPLSPLDTAEYSILHAACVSAFYCWLYLVVHGGGIEDERLQTAVQDGLADAEQLLSSPSELSPFLLIPAFCLGMAALGPGKRASVIEVFDGIDDTSLTVNKEKYLRAVEHSWRKWDNDEKASWDWTK